MITIPNPFSAPIVGAWYRKPAKAILAALHNGCPLELRAEPDNPYDPWAVSVFVSSDHFPETDDEFYSACASHGYDRAAMKEILFWHIGYICSTKSGSAKIIQPRIEEIESCKLSTKIGIGKKGPEQVYVANVYWKE